MNKTKKRKNDFIQGFTLIEILAALAIMGIMLSIILISFNSSKRDVTLKSAQREVASAIKMAHAYALQGKTQNEETPCGYGFRFTDSDSYMIFYNKFQKIGSDNDCNDQNERKGYRRYGTFSQEAESYDLGNGVKKDGAALSSTTVYFAVPHGEAYNTSGDSFSQLNINLLFGKGVASVMIGGKGEVTETDITPQLEER